MINTDAKSILRSVKRLAEAEFWYNKFGHKYWLWFMHRESGILLRRSFRFWLRVRIQWLVIRVLVPAETVPLKLCPRLWAKILAKLRRI